MYKFSLFVILFSFSSALFASSLVGKIVPPYPDGMTSNSGACIAKALGLLRVCDYSIGLLEDSSKKLTSMYLGKKEPRNAEGTTTWKIIDQIPYPEIKSGQALMLATCQRLNETEIDESIVAVAKIADGEWLTAISWAYTGNFKEGKFLKEDVKNIKCINDAIGNE